MGALIDHLMQEQGATREQARAALRDWKIIPFEDGEMMMNNNEIHFAVEKGRRLKLGRLRMIDRIVSGLLDEHKFLVTRLNKIDPAKGKANDREQKLIELFGFRYTHSDNEYNYFWLTERAK